MRNWLIITLFTFAIGAHAQFTEIGVFGGGTLFIGDVGNQQIHIPQGYVGGISFRRQFNTHYGLRAHGAIGNLANADAQSNWVAKQERNLAFRSSIWEVGLVLEVNFLEYITGSKKMRHSPYIFGGLAIFGFNPQGQYTDGEWYDLQPLGTEGQGTEQNANGKYGRNGVSMPFGFGYRFSFAPNFSVAAEVGLRSTSTDYLDDTGGLYADVEQLRRTSGEMAAYFADRSLTPTDKTGYARIHNDNNDWYVFTGIHLYFAITPKNERCSRF